MPKQSTNRNDTWFINESDKTWTLTKNAKITVENGHGIYEAGSSGNTINVFGDVKVTGMAYGVYVNGSDSEVNVGKDSFINSNNASDGIHSGAAGAHIENRGRIESNGAAAIGGAIWSDVENYGLLKGYDGISHQGSGSQISNYGKIDATNYGITEDAGGTKIENGKGGEIIGDVAAIYLMDSGTAEIINRGILRGETAIETGGDVQTVRNMGKIFGDVLLGSGADVFDSRKGSVKGEVHGGDGDDEYYVGKSKIKIVEEDGGVSGHDEVFSTANHKLAANVEELTLLGKKDLDGTGNGQMNWLYGNGGDNVLKGGGGSDYLFGRGGNDTLIGGEGARDYFVFDRKGVDRITDFEDGVDLVIISGVNSQADFDALDIRNLKGGDLQISFGNGNKIIIEDMREVDFTYNGDVTFLV
ncbi:hypothetical protein [Rhizobium sp.]